MKKINEIMHTPTWLFIVLIIVLIFRVPSFFEPYSYGDEMIYLTLGEGARQGVPLYKNLHDNKPPLLYLTAGLAGSLFWFKVILTLSMLTTIYLFWKLVDKLFPKNDLVVKISVLIFALFTTIPTLEGNIANAELFMIGPIILAFLILMKEKVRFYEIFLAGSLFSIATLFKVPAMFDVPVILFLWFLQVKNVETFKKLLHKTFVLFCGFTVPILLTFIYYSSIGAFKEYLAAAFMQNVGYLSSWRPDSVRAPFLTRNGPLLIRAGITGLGLAIIYILKHKLSKPFIFASVWLICTLFAVTLSERPYPHYLIQSLAPISILFGMLVGKKNIEQVLVIIPITLFLIVPVYYKFWYYQTGSYYARFFKLISNQISKDEYLQSFSDQTLMKYDVSKFIKSSTDENDRVYVWGDTSTIYALSKRLPPIKWVADYHISDFSSQEKVYTELLETKPKFVVILPNSGEFPLLRVLLKENYAFSENIRGTEIWALLNPKIKGLISK